MPFKKGVVTNPKGRPPREREAAYLLIMKEIVTAKEWRNLCHDAYLGALGLKVKYVKGKPKGYKNDPDATPGSKLANKRFFADYLLGKPTETIKISDKSNLDIETVEMLKRMAESIRLENDDKLDEFVNEMRNHLDKLNKETNVKPS